MGALILTPQHPDYPPNLKLRLGAEAPKLYASGATNLLSRWTMAFLTADVEPGGVTRALWDMFFPVLEYEMNAVGGWQSVNEGVYFKSALEKPWISLTLFSARGLGVETFETFLAERQPPPFDSFLQRDEYERRAAAGELLLLSASEPDHAEQSREVIMRRNWLACQMADAIFIGGAERVSMQWSHRKQKLVPRRQKTYAMAKLLARTNLPLFTVDHPDNKDVLALGIPGYKPEAVPALLERLGARRGRRADPAVETAFTAAGDGPPDPGGVKQLDLFAKRLRKRGKQIPRKG